MADGPEWFAAKRFGYGAGLPISWQGWAILLAYLAVVIGAALAFAEAPVALLGVLVPATAVLILITSKTTRGDWRWRWNGEPRD